MPFRRQPRNKPLLETTKSTHHAAQCAFDHTLIMAAGFGSRMMPLTAALPKPMMALNGTTLIGCQIDALRMQTRQIYVTVGYCGDILAQHVIAMHVNGIFNTADRPSAWWIGNTLLSNVDAPVLVTTSDNFFDIDLYDLRDDYEAAGQPACMIVPVESITAAGDRIEVEGREVCAVGPEVPGNLVASGMQILRPARICQLVPQKTEFYDIWAALLQRGELLVSEVMPQAWAAVDTPEQLEALQTELHRADTDDFPIAHGPQP